MSRPLTLTVPMPPNLANARMHWRVRHKAKHDYWDRLDALYLLHQMPWPDAVPPERAAIKVRMYLGARMDHDNAMARLKFLLDWLVMSHYIADDSPKRLEWEGLPEQVVKRDGNYRVEVTLTPLASASAITR